VKEASGGRPLYVRRQSCRICESGRLELVLSLGPQPLANAFLSGPEEFSAERRFPLDTLICAECGLVQIADVIDPEVLFGHYLYVTGTSETIAEHNRRYAATVRELLSLGPRDLVVEVASNDGSLLSCFQALPARTLGIEPASNIAMSARERGVDTVNRFFDASLAAELRARYGPARAVVANNVLAHVDDPRDFLKGARELISDDGLVIVEVPYAGEMLARLEYDTIYHEHLCYFALAPLSRLAADVGLRLVKVDRVPVHGGSIRVYFARGRGDESAVRSLLDEERRAGVTSPESWERFGRAAERHALELRELLERLTRERALLAGYGAPAKGNTLLNFCRIDRSLLPFTVDRNPLKVGRYTPGMHIPVLPVESLIASGATHVCILAWNFAEEIMRQQQAHADHGGHWILPIPHPRVI
jgi:hypothetical protein